MTRSLEALQQDFLNLKFGMFIHYNMATYKGVQWVDGYPDPSTFDPGGPVDTDAWADAAVAANERNKNFLLNIGPDKQGRISDESLRALQEIGMLRQEQHRADRALCPAGA